MKLYWPIKNNPKNRKIYIKSNEKIGFLWEISTLKEWWVSFCPIKVQDLRHFWNWCLYQWCSDADHITFHNSWRVHLAWKWKTWKKDVIFDYWKHWEDSRKQWMYDKRDSIWNHKPQLLFTIRIPNFDFLDTSDSPIRAEDIVLEINNNSLNWLLELKDNDKLLFFSCGIFDWKSLSDSLKTWIDPHGLKFVWDYLNAKMMPFGEFSDSDKWKDWWKFLFLCIRKYSESDFEDQIEIYPYLFSVSEYNELWSTPY